MSTSMGAEGGASQASDAEQGYAKEGYAEEGYTVTGADRTVHFAPTRGRRRSWVAVIIMIIAFSVGGFGVAIWNWWIAGIAGAIFAVAFLASLAAGIMDDTH